MKLDIVIPKLKNIQTGVYQLEHSLSSPDISIFHQILAIFVISRNEDKNCFLIQNL